MTFREAVCYRHEVFTYCMTRVIKSISASASAHRKRVINAGRVGGNSTNCWTGRKPSLFVAFVGHNRAVILSTGQYLQKIDVKNGRLVAHKAESYLKDLWYGLHNESL